MFHNVFGAGGNMAGQWQLKQRDRLNIDFLAAREDLITILW
jgi:hypothetical protein